jgi:hypothetical protein
VRTKNEEYELGKQGEDHNLRAELVFLSTVSTAGAMHASPQPVIEEYKVSN